MKKELTQRAFRFIKARYDGSKGVSLQTKPEDHLDSSAHILQIDAEILRLQQERSELILQGNASQDNLFIVVNGANAETAEEISEKIISSEQNVKKIKKEIDELTTPYVRGFHLKAHELIGNFLVRRGRFRKNDLTGEWIIPNEEASSAFERIARLQFKQDEDGILLDKFHLVFQKHQSERSFADMSIDFKDQTIQTMQFSWSGDEYSGINNIQLRKTFAEVTDEFFSLGYKTSAVEFDFRDSPKMILAQGTDKYNTGERRGKNLYSWFEFDGVENQFLRKTESSQAWDKYLNVWKLNNKLFTVRFLPRAVFLEIAKSMLDSIPSTEV